jgi:hypothetical protein
MNHLLQVFQFDSWGKAILKAADKVDCIGEFQPSEQESSGILSREVCKGLGCEFDPGPARTHWHRNAGTQHK